MATNSPAKAKPVRRANDPMAGSVGNLRAQYALLTLKERRLVGTAGSTKISARLDTDLLAAARAKLGAKTDTELLTAALAMVAGGDDFGAWLVTRGKRLPADFELEF